MPVTPFPRRQPATSYLSDSDRQRLRRLAYAEDMDARFRQLPEPMQRAYIELARFQLGEPTDVAALERVASEDALWTLTDDVQSVIDDIYERFPHVGEDDDAEKKTGGAR